MKLLKSLRYVHSRLKVVMALGRRSVTSNECRELGELYCRKLWTCLLLLFRQLLFVVGEMFRGNMLWLGLVYTDLLRIPPRVHYPILNSSLSTSQLSAGSLQFDDENLNSKKHCKFGYVWRENISVCLKCKFSQELFRAEH